MKRPSLRRPIEAPKQLLVEGRTSEIFFREWVEAAGLKGAVEVRDYGSLADLTAYLRVFTGYKEFRESVVSVGVVRDAEERPAASAFQAVCAALSAVNLPIPDELNAFSAGNPRTGIFVLPDCEQPGMLETLCWSVLGADPKLADHLGCVATYVACLRKNNVEIRNEAKAKVWTYLAGRGQFDPQVGRAAQAKMWDWASPTFQPLSAFLKAL
jgi:hypothetical protein